MVRDNPVRLLDVSEPESEAKQVLKISPVRATQEEKAVC